MAKSNIAIIWQTARLREQRCGMWDLGLVVEPI